MQGNKQIRVLHFSTHFEQCGIGRYQEMFLESMKKNGAVYNEFFPVSPNKSKLMNKSELGAMISQLETSLSTFDILHVQHEFSFYRDNEMDLVVSTGERLGKKVIVTVHTSPNVIDTRLGVSGLGPRSWLNYIRKLKRRRWLYKSMIRPLTKADLVIVHNQVTKDALIDRGVDEHKITKINIPVPAVDHTMKTDKITKELNIKRGDIVLSTVGFLHRFKGLKEAVKSLCYLPENYKLAIIGGLHPHTDDVKIYDEVSDLIRDLNLVDRVYITGYISDDEEMNALIRETDICVFPYDKDYYSNVSSAALNNSFANYVPAVVYPTKSFVEINDQFNCLTVTSTYSYYELARSVKSLDISKAIKASKDFAHANSYDKIAEDVERIYANILN